MRVRTRLITCVLLGLTSLGGPTASIHAADPSIHAPLSAPICAHRPPPAWVTEARSPADGVPDPAGRIVFGQLTRMDPEGLIVSLYAVDLDGSDLVQLLDCDVARPRFSPDGSLLALTVAMDDGTFQVATLRPDGTDLRLLTTTEGLASTPDWSPDGSWLVYDHLPVPCRQDECLRDGGEGYHITLWRMDANGGNPRPIAGPNGRLTGGPNEPPGITQDLEPRLSPDGTRVVFTRNDAPGYETRVYIRDLTTGAEHVAIAEPRGEMHPDWSPDGRWIVYNTHQIERVSADDPTDPPVVLYPSDEAWKPTYSPDGQRIAFLCELRLCTMAADGSDVVVVVTATGQELNHLAWGRLPEEGG